MEFGAANGVKFSNSLHLERDLGWSGLLAEPAHIWRPALLTNRNCFIDLRCVWTETGQRLMFNQASPIAAHSTLDTFSEQRRPCRHPQGRPAL